MQPKNNRQPKMDRAFTLIELLVVIAIVGILAGLAAVNMNGATEGAKMAKSKVFANSVNNSLLSSRISEWNFDETSGATTTDMIGANNGALNGFSFDLTDGWRGGSSCASGGCLQFDGVDDYVNIGSRPQLNGIANAVTVLAWVKTSAVNGSHDIVGRGNDWSLFKSGGSYSISIRNSSNVIVVASSAFSSSDWVFVAGSYDKDNGYVNLYINGVLVKTIAQSGPIRLGQTQNQIGNGYEWHSGGTYNDYWWDGLIDSVRIYSAAITTSVIRDQYLADLGDFLARGQITKQDYQQRIADLNLTYAVNE